MVGDEGLANPGDVSIKLGEGGEINLDFTRYYRVVAIGVILLLLLIVVKLALSFFNFGIKLLALGNPYKQIYQQILDELIQRKRGGTGNSSARRTDST